MQTVHDFDLLDSYLSKSSSDDCEHTIVSENGLLLCKFCAKIIGKEIDHRPDNKFYSSHDNKRHGNTGRYQERKVISTCIRLDDVANLNISNKVISKADEIYRVAANEQIFRGKTRRSLIFACVYYAYISSGNKQPYENLRKLFGLSVQAARTGVKSLWIATVQYPEYTKVPSDPNLDLITEVLTKINKYSVDNVNYILDMYYTKIQNRTEELSRPRVDSVIVSLIYYWVLHEKLEIVDIKKFAELVEISKETIKKIYGNIAKVLN